MRVTLGCEDQKSAEAAMRDVAVAPKLAALKDLLAQCGVTGGDGAEDESGDGGGHSAVGGKMGRMMSQVTK